jgi:hypothetical protein
MNATPQPSAHDVDHASDITGATDAPSYPDDMTAREGRALYFATGGIPADGGYEDDWVKLKMGPIPVGFPNTEGRRRAVKLHDLHHVLTGYGTSWTGEAEISAWEIASGCASYTAAWVINLGGLFIGLVVNPRRTRRAFLRGCGANNLYHGEPFSEALLDQNLGTIRARLAFDGPVASPNAADSLRWLAWAGASIVYAALTIGLVVGGIVALLRWLF